MGMYSWLCKGCSYELNEGEYVRLDGSKQVYDGYGGTAGRADISDPSTWHCRCYDAALTELKLDDSPGKHAPDQGMGFAKLEFLKDFDQNRPITYKAIIYVDHYDGNDTTRWEFFLTDKGLEDEKAYRFRINQIYDEMEKDRPEDYFEKFCQMTDEERNAESFARVAEAERRIGGKSPNSRSLTFQNFEACLAAVEPLIASSIPSVAEGTYHLAIFGHQSKVTGGVVYERIVAHKYDDNYAKLNETETMIWRSEVTT